jgi:8-oxo-dGTP diphosphatase
MRHDDTTTVTVEPSTAELPRGAIAIITDRRGRLLLHLRDDIDGIAWPGCWSVLGGGCESGEDPAEAIVRELAEEAGLVANEFTPLFEILDEHGSGQLLTVFASAWDGDEQDLPLTEGVKLQFFDPATSTCSPSLRTCAPPSPAASATSPAPDPGPAGTAGRPLARCSRPGVWPAAARACQGRMSPDLAANPRSSSATGLDQSGGVGPCRIR